MKFKIDKKDILQIASTPDIYRRGARYYEENRIIDIKYEKQSDELIVSSVVSGNYREYKIKIRFDISGVLLSHSCDCQSHIVWKGGCKHVVSTLLKIHDDNLNYCKDALNNAKAQSIIEGFEKHIFSAIDSRLKAVKTGSVFLIPCIKINEKNQGFISLFIGGKKTYVIKNIADFIENIKNENAFAYGKDFNMIHSLNMFEDKSRDLAKLILSYAKLQNGKYMSLCDDFTDQFFSLYKNSRISVEAEGFFEKKLTILTDTAPEIDFDLNVDTKENWASIGQKTEKCKILFGRDFGYIFNSNGIYPVQKGFALALKTLYDELDGQKDGIIFKDKAYHGFMAYIYPKLLNLGFFEDTLSPSAFPKSPELYFDMPKNSVEAKIVYPENYAVNIYYKNPVCYAIEEYFKLWGFSKTDDKYLLSGDEDIYNFLISDFSEIKDICEIFVTDSYKKKNINAGLKLSVGIKLTGNLLSVSLDTGGYSFHELMEAAASLNIKKKYYRFKDGSFIDLQNKDMDTFQELSKELPIKASQEDKTFHLPKYKSLFFDDILLENNTEYNADKAFESFIKEFRNSKNLQFEIPENISAILRPYQKIGFQWLKTLIHFGFGGILADEMGLGKTIQMIAFILSEKNEYKGSAIVICPTSLIYNWQKEILKFAPELSCAVITGNAKERLDIFKEQSNADVFLITYDTLKRDIENFLDFQFNLIILDEAQYIKNPATKTALAVKTLKGNHRFALTGTPIENSLSELWSIFDFILPGHLHSYTKFQELYEKAIVKDEDETVLIKLRKQISPFILRRTKKEVLKELPDKVYTILYAELTKEQKKLYLANFLKAKGELDGFITEGTLGKNKIKILSQLTRLRQICCHPSLYVENYNAGSGKLDITIDTIKSAIASGHRILLFSQFTSMLGIIQKYLDELHIAYFYLDGSTPAQKRSELTDQFNSGSADIFLISLKAGGAGLNLTGADIIIHYDQWWNPAVMEQASDRAHRIGQKKTVQIYNIIAKDTLEEKIIELQNRKKDLIENVLINKTNFINLMEEKEIKELFNIH